jgi:hypothetical protein
MHYRSNSIEYDVGPKGQEGTRIATLKSMDNTRDTRAFARRQDRSCDLVFITEYPTK